MASYLCQKNMKKNNFRRSVLSSLMAIYLLVGHAAHAQLSEEYIKNYLAHYDIKPPSVSVSPNGKLHAYQFDATTIHLHDSKGYTALEGDQLIGLYDDFLFFQKQKSLFKVSVKNPSKQAPITVGNIESRWFVSGVGPVYFADGQVLVFSEVKWQMIPDVITATKEREEKSSAIEVQTRFQYFYILGKAIFQVPARAKYIVSGYRENLIATDDQLFIHDKGTNELRKEDNNIAVKLDSMMNLRAQCWYENGLVQFTTFHPDTAIGDFYLSGNQLDVDYFMGLATDHKVNYNLNCWQLSLRDGRLSKEHVIQTRESRFGIMPKTTNSHSLDFKGVVVNQRFVQESGIPQTKIHLYHLHSGKKIDLDSLVNNLKGYTLTPDAASLFLLDKRNTLFRHTFENGKTEVLMTNYPSVNRNLERNDGIDPLLLAHYDAESGTAYFNTKRFPIRIDASGKIDSIVIKLNNASRFNNTALYRVIAPNKFLIYNLDEETGISEIYYVANHQATLLTSNDSYKAPEGDIYGPSSGKAINGFTKTLNNSLVWTESNLKTGTKVFSYNLGNNRKRELSVLSEKRHDSLDYQYFSHFNGKELIRGGLMFPKGYDPAKKYPLILSIYLNKTEGLHFANMGNVVLDISNGAYSALMRTLNLLHQGFIVGVIDVPFANGIYSSHSQYTNDIIRKVLPRFKSIDLDNIALFGHSRTAGQSMGTLVLDDGVKCAIISNGILSELLDFTRFTDYNKRAGGSLERASRFHRKLGQTTHSPLSLFEEIRDNFKHTRPIDPFFKLDRLNSSVLFLLNDGDGSISSNTGYYTYIKTKLLNKNTYLLNFHNEGHSLTNFQNQKLAYDIMIDYLNFFLKEGNDRNAPWRYRGTKQIQ